MALNLFTTACATSAKVPLTGHPFEVSTTAEVQCSDGSTALAWQIH